MPNPDFDFNDPDFRNRCREVNADLEIGVPMTLGEIADRLGMDFDLFAEFLAAEMFSQAPDLRGVVVGEIVQETVQ